MIPLSILLVTQSIHWQTPIGRHWHPYWEISVNIEGSATADIDGREVPYTPGTILCVPPNTLHSFPAAAGFVDLFYQTDSPPTGPLSTGALVLHDDGNSSFTQLLHVARHFFEERQSGYQGVLQALGAAMERVLQSYVQSGALNPVVSEIQACIRRQFADPQFSIQTCLLQTGYSAEYIRTLFRKELGMTPTQYLQWVRVESAKQLIAGRISSQLSFGEIAEACGWLDTHYFNRVFKKQTGMSPSQYYDFCNRSVDPSSLIQME